MKFVTLIALALAAAVKIFAANDPFAEGVRTTDPLRPEEQQKKFHVPPGFEVQLVGAEPWLRKPMNMQFDTAGRLWFTESREYPWPTNYTAPRDTIRILSDFDANGRAQKLTVFATNLNSPIGLYPFQSPASDNSNKLTWKCIAWSIPNIWLFEDVDGDGVADKKTKLYGPFDHTRDTHGNQASFRRGFDGWLYATHGFNNDSHVTARDGSHVDLNSGNTYRIRLDGSRIEHHTHGQVNPFGLAWDAFGNLYSSDCHSAPTYQLLEGGFYPSFGKPHDGLGFAPVLMEHSHGSTAIDGMVYYTDDLWPAEFQNNTFIGNVMTSRVNRDRVVFNGSSPRAIEQDDFVKCEDPWFRPVDNQLAPDGAFYIADFYNRIIGHYEVPLTHPMRDRGRGRIWRVVYKGADGKAKLRPLALPNDLDGLIKEMGSPNLPRRLLAMNAIYDRFGKSAVPNLQRADEIANEFMQVHLLWLLHRLEALTGKQLETAAASDEPLIRVHAARIAAQILEQQSRPGLMMDINLISTAHDVATQGLKDRDTLVQRCAAEALGYFYSSSSVRPLLELRARVPGNDTHLLYVVRKSLRNVLQREPVFQKILTENWTEQEQRAISDVSLAITNSIAASFLVAHLQKFSDPRDVTANVLKHAARFLPAGQIDDLASLSRDKFRADVDLQSALFKSVNDGLKQRGTTLSAKTKAWGTELASALLTSTEQADANWFAANGAASGAGSPWVVQRRKCADGREADFLCTLPSGEQTTGVLRSRSFASPSQLTLWIAGHDGFPDKPLQKKNFVVLKQADSSDVLMRAPAPRNDIAQKITWNLSAFAGKQVFIELVDGDTAGAYAWLAVGRFNPNVAPMPKLTPKLIDERLQSAAQIALATKDTSLERELAAALKLSAGFDARASIATALLAMNADKYVAASSEMLSDVTAPEPLRVKLAQAIADANTDAARGAVLDVLRRSPERAQPKLAVALVSSRPGAEALLKDVEGGKISARVLQNQQLKEKLIASKTDNIQARLAALTSNLTPLNDQIQKVIDQRSRAFNVARASAVRGTAAFEKNCVACHQLDGKGALVGPQLDGIGARGPERIMEDILDPNRNVDPAFRSTMFVLNDDDVVSGLFRREEGELLIYAESTGKELSVPKKNIKERRPSELSLMPENFADTIPLNDFNDLIAYLLTKTGTKR